ncbi:aldo-keto reductase family 1 member b10 [Stylonychia lemnae]|uniref:Aldo-keto reductase family 1 member b10 n=1 Tax=Stylonychia lemnae TaxID=5949 RepID=A0A078AM47_STYLE|nr:aldo-keto reductase family 1 member b10 [Stylonychia lemnae]|eukprot:CDW83450.1 aldo-keto reductase family 1 member b10 [Stylonychia lemnae]
MNSKDAVVNAVKNLGYRHIDTAWLYQNEQIIGEALHEILNDESCKISREEICLVTKIWPTQFQDPESAVKESLKKLGVDYIDVYLIHWPTQFADPSTRVPLHVLWKTLESFVDQGLVRSLGISNFNLQLTADLLTYAKHKPVCNQVELHPYCNQSQLVKFLLDNQIVPVAYCPLGRPSIAAEPGQQEVSLKYTKVPDLRQDPKIISMATKYNKSEFQVALRWNTQRGCGVIPKSASSDHQKENLEINDFILEEEDMIYLSSLNQNLRICNNFEFLKGYDIFA